MPSTVQPPVSPPRRSAVLKLVVVLISTGLALGAAELVLRALHPFGFRMRGNTLVLPANKVYDIRADPRSRSDQIDAHVVHTKNSLGFRGPEPPADFADWLTIVAVGGSTTECFYLSDGRTWPERLAARLQPELRKVWVDNAGLDGHSTFGHLLLTRQALVPLHPKVTLYLAGVNDMFTDEPRGFDRVARNRWAALADHSELAATLLNLDRWRRTKRLEDLGAMPKPVALRDRPLHPVPPEVAQRLWQEQDRRLGAFRERLEQLIALNREHGMEPVLITQPTLLGGVDPRTGIDTRPMEVELWEKLDGALAWRLLERYNDVTRQVGKERGVLTIDLAHAMPKDSTFFYDFFHFTNQGADRVGEIVHGTLAPWLAARYPDRVIRPR
ncbi:MAG TPA: SGNH/GDSL hydrolase family protein [Thermoanaerobaculia bacterium]|nr:SGNH/GDSL hydrolase family protein [Thermoanaerobaculia bacterium]